MSDHNQKEPDYHQHLQDIIGLAQQSQHELANITYEQFQHDFTLIRSTMTILSICGEAVKKLPKKLIEEHQNVELHKLPRLRDRIAHQYGILEIDLIWQHATIGLPRVLAELTKHYPQCVPTTNTPTGGLGR